MLSKNDTIKNAARIAAPVFASEGWTYGSGVKRHIPDEFDLAVLLRGLYGDMAKTTISISSGRFTVQRIKDESGDTGEFRIYLELGFIPVKYPEDWTDWV